MMMSFARAESLAASSPRALRAGAAMPSSGNVARVPRIFLRLDVASMPDVLRAGLENMRLALRATRFTPVSNR